MNNYYTKNWLLTPFLLFLPLFITESVHAIICQDLFWEKETTVLSLEEAIGIPAHSDNPSRMAARVHLALKGLTSEEFSIYVLRHAHERSVETIAAFKNMSPRAVLAHLDRAKKKVDFNVEKMRRNPDDVLVDFLNRRTSQIRRDYRKKLKALETFLRSHFVLMTADINHSINMTENGQFSFDQNPTLYRTKLKQHDILNRLFNQIDFSELISGRSVHELRLSQTQALYQLRKDGHVLIDRLFWNGFKVDDLLLSDIHERWIKIHQGHLHNVDRAYKRRLREYEYWPTPLGPTYLD